MIECRLANGANILVERKVNVQRDTETFTFRFVSWENFGPPSANSSSVKKLMFLNALLTSTANVIGLAPVAQ